MKQNKGKENWVYTLSCKEIMLTRYTCSIMCSSERTRHYSLHKANSGMVLPCDTIPLMYILHLSRFLTQPIYHYLSDDPMSNDLVVRILGETQNYGCLSRSFL